MPTYKIYIALCYLEFILAYFLAKVNPNYCFGTHVTVGLNLFYMQQSITN